MGVQRDGQSLEQGLPLLPQILHLPRQHHELYAYKCFLSSGCDQQCPSIPPFTFPFILGTCPSASQAKGLGWGGGHRAFPTFSAAGGIWEDRSSSPDQAAASCPVIS